MSNMKDSLQFREEVIMDGEKLVLPSNPSGKIIGMVTCQEYDRAGHLIFSETTKNDITLPGSIFVLEQMFKRGSGNYRFLHPNSFPVGFGSTEKMEGKVYSVDNQDNTDWNAQTLDSSVIDKYISDEFIFGFMVGQGGETSSSIIAPTYEHDALKDSGGTNAFLPFRIKAAVRDTDPINEGNKNPSDDGVDYFLKIRHDANDAANDYYFAKGFTVDPKIYTKWADGSGTVTSADIGYNVPILAYAEVTLDIDEEDIRGFFSASNSESCYINQLGLVAGKSIFVHDRQGLFYKDLDTGEYTKTQPTNFEHTTSENQSTGETIITATMYRQDFNDVKLITTLNFKSKDLSNDENKLKFIYKIYCL